MAVNLNSIGGRPVDSPFSFTYQLGHPAGAEPLRELLVGPVRREIDPGKLLHAPPDDDSSGELERTQDWPRVTSVSGVFDFNAILGERQNACVATRVNLYSSHEQAVQLWVAQR